MDTARWITAGLFVLFSLVGSFAQWNAMFLATRRLRADENAGGYSLVPLVVGLLGVFGMLLAPASYLQRLWWIPLLVDPGCALMFGSVAIFAIGNLVRRFTGPTT